MPNDSSILVGSYIMLAVVVILRLYTLQYEYYSSKRKGHYAWEWRTALRVSSLRAQIFSLPPCKLFKVEQNLQNSPSLEAHFDFVCFSPPVLTSHCGCRIDLLVLDLLTVFPVGTPSAPVTNRLSLVSGSRGKEACTGLGGFFRGLVTRPS